MAWLVVGFPLRFSRAFTTIKQLQNGGFHECQEDDQERRCRRRRGPDRRADQEGAGMSEKNPAVDAFLARQKKWRDEFENLRRIALECQLTEEVKWMHPCYTLGGKNVVLMHGFKEYCAFLFFKGVLLKDPAGILIQQTENVQAGRQVRFTNIDQIVELEPVLKAYIQEAIEVERAGLKVELKTTGDFEVAEEFQRKLDEITGLKEAFEALTPGRQRAYLSYFSQAKQARTREARVDKYIQHILDGKGMND
jgi:uncharacterized protein YdeI (YjbR/CyaY-like superfamily)